MFEQASVAGSVDATLELGRAYASGHNVDLDSERGISLLYASLWQWLIEAGRLAALAYMSGRGVEKKHYQSKVNAGKYSRAW